MDPEATLSLAADLFASGDYREALDALKDYDAWRRKGGFEPEGGDRRMRALLKKVMAAGPFKRNPKRRGSPRYTPRELFDAAARGTDQAYKGYRIYFNALRSEWYVSKGGAHIGTFPRVSEAKAAIDLIADPGRNPQQRGTLWEYVDSAGVKRRGTVEKTSDKGGSDVTYFFRRSTGELDVLSGSRLRQAKVLRNPAPAGRKGRWFNISYDYTAQNGQTRRIHDRVWDYSPSEAKRTFLSQVLESPKHTNISVAEAPGRNPTMKTRGGKARRVVIRGKPLSVARAMGYAGIPFIFVREAGVNTVGDIPNQFIERLRAWAAEHPGAEIRFARHENPKRRKKMPLTPEDRGILRAMVKEHGKGAVAKGAMRTNPLPMFPMYARKKTSDAWAMIAVFQTLANARTVGNLIRARGYQVRVTDGKD
jgi:hypothetical protein